jgi:hypothetical protein
MRVTVIKTANYFVTFVGLFLKSSSMNNQRERTAVKDMFELAKKANREVARKNMALGLIWCMGGILVTSLTYQAASGGGHYIVAWGAIIFGAIQFVRGLGQLLGNL